MSGGNYVSHAMTRCRRESPVNVCAFQCFRSCSSLSSVMNERNASLSISFSTPPTGRPSPLPVSYSFFRPLCLKLGIFILYQLSIQGVVCHLTGDTPPLPSLFTPLGFAPCFGIEMPETGGGFGRAEGVGGPYGLSQFFVRSRRRRERLKIVLRPDRGPRSP